MLPPANQLPETRTDIDDLSARITLLENAKSRLEEDKALLVQENRWLKQQLFGRSSEKRSAAIPANQSWLFNEAEAVAAPAKEVTQITIPAHSRKSPGRKPIADDLPRVDIIHDLPEAEKTCPKDGAALECIGDEKSEQLDFIPARVQVLRHIRLKYACPCCKSHMKLAEKPAQILPKSNAAPSLLAHIACAKYVDGLPLNRQEKQFHRLGLNLPRATTANWMIKLAQAVIPIINLLNDHLLDGPLIHCDETTLQVLRSEKAPSSDHFMWVRAGGLPARNVLLFDYASSRSAETAKHLLLGFKGILLTDGYEAYNNIAEAQGLVHAGCLAHVRRYFKDVIKSQPEASTRANIALDYIGKLYDVERELRQRKVLPTANERLDARQKKCVPIMTEFKAWLDDLAPKLPPKVPLAKAVHYALGQWQKLSVYLTEPIVPLDNNRCENAIRPFVIGRRNWLFCDTSAGATASARLYSLVETARANQLEPHAYLTHLFTHLPAAATIDKCEALLPWNVKIETPAKARASP
jgi:transposase